MATVIPMSFPEYLRRVRGDRFRELLEAHVRSHPWDLPADCAPEERRPVTAKVVRTELVIDEEKDLVRTRRGLPCMLEADLVVRGVWRTEGGYKEALYYFRYFLDVRYTAEFLLRGCEGRPDPRRACYGPLIMPEERMDATTMPTDPHLIPCLKKEDYPGTARRVLARWIPDAFRNRPLIPIYLAQQMGLRVREVRFEAGSKAAGKIFFRRQRILLRARDGSVYEEEARPFTVYLNRDLCRSDRDQRLTLLHECAHLYLALPFFMLQAMAGTEVPEACCRRTELRQPLGPADWMELQARKLPAYLLMEEERTRRRCEEDLQRRGGVRSPENMRELTETLMKRFLVSRSMARLRLIELGYPEAEGVFCYVDGHAVPDYGCAGAWEPGRSYVISFGELSRLYSADPAIRGLLDSGAFVYAEGHLCRNEAVYVQLRPGRSPALTPAARERVDECCVAFTAEGGRLPGLRLEGAWAARTEEDRLHYRLPKPDLSPGTVAWDRDKALFLENARLWDEMRRELDSARSPKEAVNLLRKRKGLSWESLALEIGVSRPTLDGWLKGNELSLPHLAAICVGLRLRGDVGQRLLEVCECRTRRNPNAAVYLSMIQFAMLMSVEYCNDVLAQAGLPPLHQGAA
ncbi:MAG: helix-turn-helix domain-containing protein [Oscillospiraceae bacterium]|nr:helix-turn-helix domain-containing protein [Oscillospiraceae bacterium]